MSIKALNLAEQFIVMSPAKTVTVESVNPSLYQKLDQDYDGFKGHELIAVHNFSEDWNSWEMHPNGDELVVLISGEITFTFELEQGEQSTVLDQLGSCLIVPRGVWHTAFVERAAQVLFITPGEGTEHRNS